MTSLTETYIKWYVDRRRGRNNKVMWKNNEQAVDVNQSPASFGTWFLGHPCMGFVSRSLTLTDKSAMYLENYTETR